MKKSYSFLLTIASIAALVCLMPSNTSPKYSKNALRCHLYNSGINDLLGLRTASPTASQGQEQGKKSTYRQHSTAEKLSEPMEKRMKSESPSRRRAGRASQTAGTNSREVESNLTSSRKKLRRALSLFVLGAHLLNEDL